MFTDFDAWKMNNLGISSQKVLSDVRTGLYSGQSWMTALGPVN